jgi:GLPGLI family protein
LKSKLKNKKSEMKTFLKLSISFCLFLILSSNVLAQNSFSGQIIYNLSYDGLEINDAMKAMLPEEMTLTLKQNKSKTEIKTGMGDQISIFDGNTKSSVSLINMMGQKVAIRKSLDEVNLDRNKYPDLKVTLIDETKEIAGYECSKAVIEVNAADFDGLSTFIVFYTEELGNMGINYSDPLFGKIKGVMLEYEIKTRGLLMKFKASEINKSEVSDDDFLIPEDYKEMSAEELKKMFGND